MKQLLALVLALVILLSLAACGKEENVPTIPSTAPSNSTEPTKDPGELSELYKRNSYTVEDSQVVAAHDTVVATLGSAELTNGMIQIYYWMDVYNFLSSYGSYAELYGLDRTKPLDQQDCDYSAGSWQHYFLASGLESWHYYQALALMADETQTPMAPAMQEKLDSLYDVLEQEAKERGFENIDALIQADAGIGCNAQDYYNYTELSYKGYSYFDTMLSTISITDDMIADYFTKNEEKLKESGITKESGDAYSVRHILLRVDDEKFNGNWDACQAAAQKLLDEWLAGEATEDTFAALAAKHSSDSGSSYNGGLYEGLSDDTNFVEEFKNWYLDTSRKVGDYGLVKSTYGYHIMYFSGRETEWIYQCREALKTELTAQFVTEAMENYTLNVDYEKILLAEIEIK